MQCINCGKPLNNGEQICSNCGTYQGGAGEQPSVNMNNQGNFKSLKCPRCGGTNLQAVSDVSGKGAKLWKLCLCRFLGLCGVGKTKTKHFWVCANCGNKFKL